MRMTMFGFLSAAATDPTTPRSAAVAISSDKPLLISFRFICWFCVGFVLVLFLHFGFGFVLMIHLRLYRLCLFSEEKRAARFRATRLVVNPCLSPRLVARVVSTLPLNLLQNLS